MFNLHDYVLDLVKKMIDNEVAEYKIMKFALDYYEKEVLTDEDMTQIEEWLNPVEPEVVTEAGPIEEKTADTETEAPTEEVNTDN